MEDKDKMMLIAQMLRAGGGMAGGMPDPMGAMLDVGATYMNEEQRREEEEKRLKAMQGM